LPTYRTERKSLSGRTQDPGTTALQLIVRDLAALGALGAKLRAAGVPIVTTGGEPVEIAGAEDPDRPRSEQPSAGTGPARSGLIIEGSFEGRRRVSLTGRNSGIIGLLAEG